MNLLANFSIWGGWFTGYVVPFLFVLTIVVFFHELGHFLIARWCGVRVLTFSIGFGPELIGFNDRHGTRWKLSAIPLGGYVKFFGDDNAASVPDQDALKTMSEAEQRDSFFYKPVWRRAAIVAAGPSIRTGHARQWAIGMRISGEPRCAITEPSRYSTMPWMIDCG